MSWQRVKKLYHYSSGSGLALKNSFFLILDQFLNLGISLVITVALARYFGPVDLGSYNLGMAICGLVSVIANLGIQSHVKRAVASDVTETSKVASQAYFIRFSLSLPISALVVYLTTLMLINDSGTISLIQMLNLYVFFIGMQALNGGILVSLRRSQKVLKISLLQRLLSLVGLFFVVWSDANLSVFALLLVVISFVVFIFSVILVRSERPIDLSLDFHYCRKMILASAPLALAAAVEFANLKIDTILIGSYLGQEQVGYYSAVFNVLIAVVLIPLAVTKALFPDFVQAFNAGSDIRATKFFLMVVSIFVCYSVFVVIIISLYNQVVIVQLFGNEFLKSVPALKILTFAIPFVVLNRLFNYVLVATFQDKAFLLINLSGLTANFIGNIFLIPDYGIVGAAISTVITEFLVMFFSAIIVLRTLGCHFVSASKLRSLW